MHSTINLQKLAGKIYAYKSCVEHNKDEWAENHLEWIEKQNEILPSGSGFDSGCEIDVEKSGPEKIIIKTSYHHMHENGYYDGWTYHNIKITSSLLYGFELKISGSNKGGIKEYIEAVMNEIFTLKN